MVSEITANMIPRTQFSGFDDWIRWEISTIVGSDVYEALFQEPLPIVKGQYQDGGNRLLGLAAEATAATLEREWKEHTGNASSRMSDMGMGWDEEPDFERGY